jgi:hypothetical protein
MKFRTEIELDPSSFAISHRDKIVTLGSCFAENIFQYLKSYLFNILENPFGVLYNPVSIYKSVELAVNRKIFTTEDLIFHQDEYHSFYHHSDFSDHREAWVLENINSGITRTHNFLKEADIVIISLGTAFVFKHKTQNLIVSNCHKLPSSEFDRFMLSYDEAAESLNNIISILKAFNPKLKFIFTISPVRHWRDGAIQNQLSKSTLFTALHRVINDLEFAEYFPSFEIMMDDLRDYRFYAEDMIHPNKIALDYVWEKFSNTYFSAETKELIKEIGKLNSARDHRVRNPQSPQYKEFLESMIKKIADLERRYQSVNFNRLRKEFEETLAELAEN